MLQDMTLKNGDYLVPKRFGFYGPPVVTPPSDLSEDADIAKQLWKVSEEITGQKFDIGGARFFFAEGLGEVGKNDFVFSMFYLFYKGFT